MKVDRFKSDRQPKLYLLVAYGERIPAFPETSAGTFAAVGGSDTRTYPEPLCNEIEEAIRSLGYWIGELPPEG